MEQEITLRDVANYLDNVGIQFLATIGLDGKPKVRPMQYMVFEDGKLWFCTNSKKVVYAEQQASTVFSLCPHSCCLDTEKYCGEQAALCKEQSCWQRLTRF